MLADLTESYIQSINMGACPNIEDAWTQLSKIQNQKAIEETLKNFEA